jgi:YVTN family beta-propeller protein
MKPDGGEIFVENFDGHTISAINTSANEVSESFLAGDNPASAIVTSDNSLLYVSSFGTDSVGVFDVSTRKMIGKVSVGSHPDSIALSPSEDLLLVANARSGDLAIVRTDKRATKKIKSPPYRLFNLVPVGMRPNSIAVAAQRSTSGAK